jgi:predicted TIM-barrel fold metal-dependent hydrolase
VSVAGRPAPSEHPDPAQVRAGLPHPIVDADGHLVEALPVLVDYVRRVAGDGPADAYLARTSYALGRPGDWTQLDADEARRRGLVALPWWGSPTRAVDRATAVAPALLHDRLDELGIDVAIVYPSLAMAVLDIDDEPTRRGVCRGLNTYLADLGRGLEDRLTIPAVVPMHTPEEAVAELDHAVTGLGAKAIMINGRVRRPLPDAGPGGFRWDVLALDSEHDYDPFWARCVELGVAPVAHSGSMGIGLRQSPTRYMYNHVGHFAAAGEALAKALVLGGVTHRFPRLHFAFLEGGVAWGVTMLVDLLARWSKRGGRHIEALDPALVDVAAWHDHLDRWGGPALADPAVRDVIARQGAGRPAELDDFRACGVASEDELVDRVVGRFWFGCEADDPTVAWAFAGHVNPHRARLQAMLGSDIGHWDVLDMRAVVPEAHELVERGLLSAEDFRDFACDNVIRLHGGMNPAFFDGTPVADHARTVLAAADAAHADRTGALPWPT